LTPATINRALASLKIFFNWLFKKGVITSNPAEDVKLVAIANQPSLKWLDRNQQASFVRTIHEYGSLRDEALIGIMLHAGLRVSEVCALNREDIEISDRKGRVIVQHGKGNKYREVPLNVDARRAIEDYLANGRKNGSPFLFTTQRSGQATTRGIQHILAKYAKLTGLEVTPHVLRHTFCHELAVRKVPLDVIARLAGHTKRDGSRNLAMVIRYTQPGEADLRRAVEELSWR
jgi:integrase/recombinase XerC/integrase/recombinase XerD